MDTETVERLKQLLQENACSGVELANGWLQILFVNRRLVIQCSWRLVSNGNIIAASDSEAEPPDAVETLLMGRRVDEVTVRLPFYDLEINFDNGVLLQTFSDSWKYEHWNFAHRPDEMIVAGPGTLWSRWEPS